MYGISDTAINHITHIVEKNNATKYSSGRIHYVSKEEFIDYLREYKYTDNVINIEYYSDTFVHNRFFKNFFIYEILHPNLADEPDLSVIDRIIYHE